MKPIDLTNQAKLCIKQASYIVNLISNDNNPAKVVKRVDMISELLCSILDASELIRNVHPDEEWVNAASNAYVILHNYLNQLNTNQELYKAILPIIKDSRLNQQLSSEEVKVASLLISDFEKSGINMPEKQRKQFVKLNDDIQRLGQDFQSNAFPSEEIIVFNNPAFEFTGVPPKFIEALILSSNQNKSRNGDLAIVPTNSEIATYIMKTARNAETRRRIFMAMHSAENSQIEILESLLRTRAELALLLGKESFADMYLLDKMAQTPANVNSFLESLATKNRPFADSEINKLWKLKKAHTGADDGIKAW